MKFIEDYCNTYVSNSKIYNYSVQDLFNSCSIYIMPMVNPDGVNLVTGNINKKFSEYIVIVLILLVIFQIYFFPSGWKANIKGIDLNLQFPANWEQAKQIKYSQGFTRTSSTRFRWLWTSYRT